MNLKHIAIACIVLLVGFSVCFLIQNKKEFRIEDYASIPDLKEYQELQAKIPANEVLTKFTPSYASKATDENLDGIQSPIPMKDRVHNGTGIQCVWASIEALGRWAEEPKLMNPPLTSRSDCKSYSSPSLAAERLNQLNVKFEQSYKDRSKGVALIKKAMSEGRGCLWGVPGHAMVLIHYDEAANAVKWVDNSDSRLAVQTTTIPKFNDRWDSWVLVIYADNDIIPMKLGRDGLARKIPIWDMNGQQKEFPKDYVPQPKKDDLINIPRD